jgi:hypothetical protein
MFATIIPLAGRGKADNKIGVRRYSDIAMIELTGF